MDRWGWHEKQLRKEGGRRWFLCIIIRMPRSAFAHRRGLRVALFTRYFFLIYGAKKLTFVDKIRPCELVPSTRANVKGLLILSLLCSVRTHVPLGFATRTLPFLFRHASVTLISPHDLSLSRLTPPKSRSTPLKRFPPSVSLGSNIYLNSCI